MVPLGHCLMVRKTVPFGALFWCLFKRRAHEHDEGVCTIYYCLQNIVIWALDILRLQ